MVVIQKVSRQIGSGFQNQLQGFSENAAGKRFDFGKSWFGSKGYFVQSQVAKIGFQVFSKSFGRFGSGFLVRLIFSGRFVFGQSQFSAKVLASPRLWRSSNSKLISMAKSGL